MPKYRNCLPQFGTALFLTDSGMETSLIYHQGIDLPHFASFDLMKNAEGRAIVDAYYAKHAALAKHKGLGFVLETPTWRANKDWGAKLGYSPGRLARVNRDCIELMEDIRARYETPASPMPISGNIGPRGDGYKIETKMSVKEACAYHAHQVQTFADTEADFVSGFTMNYTEEAIGIILACELADIPAVISFTVETDGKMASGETMREAIEKMDAATGGYASYYMINCAHPTHFESTIAAGESWVQRIKGLRANSSKKSHAELDSSTELDEGNPYELGGQYRALRKKMPGMTVLGGCCGTDIRHVEQICFACTEVETEAA
jgi:S-methylmethionine-dependent homocysteine/selenocysteine methylase